MIDSTKKVELIEKMNGISIDLMETINRINNLREELNKSFLIDEKPLELDSINRKEETLKNIQASVMDTIRDLQESL